MTARDEVLGRIRAAIGGVPVPPVARGHRGDGGEAVDVVGLLVDRLLDYRAVVERVDPAGVRDAIASAAPGRLVVPAGLEPSWTAGLDAVTDDGLSPTELAGLAGVVTGAALAIAETGTIVLDTGPDQGRRALSLVPDLHICVLRADQVVRGVPEAIALLDPGRPLTFVSGPSATSDIELDRVEGVHGPRNLRVLVIG